MSSQGARRDRHVHSEHTSGETERTLQKPYFAERLSSDGRNDILEFLRAEATVVPITVEDQDVAPSNDDVLVLATAVRADTRYLVTGDRSLLAVTKYRDVQIVSVHELVAVLS